MTARLRQVVIAARELEPTVAALRAALPLGEPFHDPGVAEFGLINAVMAIGDTFVEVVTPVRTDAPAARFIERHGEGGYMVLIQVPDTEAARRRAAVAGARIVSQSDLPEISGTHLHPKDVPGAIVSVDTPRPPESWHWGGPEWSARVPQALGPGRVLGAIIEAPDPAAAESRWLEAVGPVPEISFRPGSTARVGAFLFAVPGAEHRDIEIAGTSLLIAPDA